MLLSCRAVCWGTFSLFCSLVLSASMERMIAITNVRLLNKYGTSASRDFGVDVDGGLAPGALPLSARASDFLGVVDPCQVPQPLLLRTLSFSSHPSQLCSRILSCFQPTTNDVPPTYFFTPTIIVARFSSRVPSFSGRDMTKQPNFMSLLPDFVPQSCGADARTNPLRPLPSPDLFAKLRVGECSWNADCKYLGREPLIKSKSRRNLSK